MMNASSFLTAVLGLSLLGGAQASDLKESPEVTPEVTTAIIASNDAFLESQWSRLADLHRDIVGESLAAPSLSTVYAQIETESAPTALAH